MTSTVTPRSDCCGGCCEWTTPTGRALGDVAEVMHCLQAALVDILSEPQVDLQGRLVGPHRQASRKVREMLRAQWHASPP